MTLDYDYLKRLERELKFRRQVLVEVTAQTKFERLHLVFKDPIIPDRGYALASSPTFVSRSEERAYLTDVNFDHRWRMLEHEMVALYPTLRHAAAALGVQ